MDSSVDQRSEPATHEAAPPSVKARLARAHRWAMGIATGLVVALVGLGIAELVAALLPTL